MKTKFPNWQDFLRGGRSVKRYCRYGRGYWRKDEIVDIKVFAAYAVSTYIRRTTVEKLKPNIIKLSGKKMSEEEFIKIEKQYAETGCTGDTSWKEFLEPFKQNPDKIISYENEVMPFNEY